MERKKDLSLVNCIATSLLAYFFTVPLHEFFHLLTHLAYGNKIDCYSATAVTATRMLDYSLLSPFHRVMVAGGSASILNAILALLLVFILLKRTLRPMTRLFLTQFMGAQAVQGFGYFLIAGFGLGDWGYVFAEFPEAPGAVAAARILLSVLGVGGIVFLLFFLNHCSYYFVEDRGDKKQRLDVGLKLHLTMFVLPLLVGTLAGLHSPAVTSGVISFGLSLLFDLMWIPFLWGFLYTAFLVKPPKQSRFLYPLPAKPSWVLLALGVALTLSDIFLFGPGIYF